MTLAIDTTDHGAVISVKVVPGGSRSRIAGLLGAALKVNLAAPAEKGRANSELTALLARQLGVPASRINILAGRNSPNKRLLIERMTPRDLRKLLLPHIL